MLHYIYDGSFDGLLTSIYEAYYRRGDIEDIVPKDSMEENFLVQKVFISTDGEKSRKVYEAIKNKISEEALKRVFYAYLSELPRHGITILKYLQLGFKFGPQVDLNLSNDIILKMDNINYKVGMEKHRMLGLIRFKQLENGILYSSIEPDYNIVGLLAPHFASRMMNENWAIHDVKRGIGVLYNKKEWVIKDIEVTDSLIIKEDEEDYQELWKAYFKSIAIQSRINPKLQKRNMPMRYWKHLVEK
ncbi:TIGR03915 family putative DNA repair protein [uncultured Tissierella sp.]|jgi:probable DNA metabolism protein|uniref:TIGR03915 family putative DNA repair protein n=1 Tax=uncultured Tissierella sp. TaxID=448160 RepID=UPI002805239E|nr:TIGR03915 family putative DNA repair protein [uncultured Tissierella sp.]MDU5081821.1 TIGR03915 family putative DNA repair protein [Bacillota bacterium]